MRFPFGRHLHNQIIVPLLAASLAVALLATFIGVQRLSGIVDSWVGTQTQQTLDSIDGRLGAMRMRLLADARLISEAPEVRAAMESRNLQAAEQWFVGLRTYLPVDYIILLGPDGTPLARAGDPPAQAPGQPLLGADHTKWTDIGMTYATFLDVGSGSQKRYTLTAIRRISYRGAWYTVLVTRVIDEEFIRSNFGGIAPAIAFCDASRTVRAHYVDRSMVVAEGAATTVDAGDAVKEEVAALEKAFTPGSASARAALESTKALALPGGEQRYVMRASMIDLSSYASGDAGHGNEGLDPTGTKAYSMIVASNAVASETATTTIQLIAFWSTLAVLVLTGLGAIIARQVSAPLNSLSESARRVADGDFGARVDIAGTNEVAELADSFNTMTDSLRERTDTLTKKVLELATLYEMSRALGSTLDLDVLLDSVLDSALRIFDVDSGYVMLRDKAHGELDLRAVRGLAGSRPDEKAIRSSMSEWVIRQGRPLIFNPPQDDRGEQQVDSVTGALAALCVPLVSGDGIIGAIAVGSRDSSYRFSSDDVRLLSTIANHVTIAVGNIELFSSLQDAYLATVRSLAAAVDAKDPYTRGHSDRVALYSNMIAAKVGLTAEQCTALEMAAYLHDIGKIGIREAILLKPGRLTGEEMGQMRHHPLIGANILRPVAFPWPIAPVVRHHHEHFDGKGYPAGLKGEEIPLLARILTVADAYEAMTADRPYRRPRTQSEAVEELNRCAGSHFDPRIVEAFIDALRASDDEVAARASRDARMAEPAEARAIFVAVCDGMTGSFRRLGGPRLASNLESDLNRYFTETGLPFSFANGHLGVDWEAPGGGAGIEQMRAAIERLAEGMEATAGRSLVDHFYDEALDGLSERMRRLADVLELYSRS